MKLIDAPIGIFRFDGELVLKTEYKSKNKQSGKYIPDCYIVRTGEYFWGGAKTANELNNLDVEPVDFAELLPTVTDTISRKAAIEALTEYGNGRAVFISVGEAVIRIEQLPPAQPERIKGHWVKISPANIYECSECGKNVMTNDICAYDFCHGCGADMRGEQDDT